MNKLNYTGWNDFFKDKSFTLFRTSLIQKRYIDTIYNYAISCGHPAKILEVAGGSGYTSAIIADLLKNYNTRVIYSDLEPTLVKIVKNNFESIKNLSFVVADSNKLPFDNNFFDILIHQGFLEHFTDEEIIIFLKEQARITKYIIFDVPNSRRNTKVQEFGNERFPSVNKWFSLIRKAELKIYYYTGRRFTNWWKKYVPITMVESAWFNKYFGESTIIVCGRSC